MKNIENVKNIHLDKNNNISINLNMYILCKRGVK